MNLPPGYEFIVTDAVPREQGLRRLNDRVIEIHPHTYEALVRLLGGLDQLARLLGAMGALGGVALALGRFAEAMKQLKPPDDAPPPPPQEPAP
jgi:hypothetical protein